MIESSGTDQEAVGGPLDDLGNAGVPGFATSGPDGDGEADEVLGQGTGIGTRVEASPGAIGETGRPPAFDGRRRRRRGAIGAGGRFRREAEESPVLVPIEGAVELLEQGGRGDLLFHEAAEDDEAAGAGGACSLGGQSAGSMASSIRPKSAAFWPPRPERRFSFDTTGYHSRSNGISRSYKHT